jgi:hypothetical protein
MYGMCRIQGERPGAILSLPATPVAGRQRRSTMQANPAVQAHHTIFWRRPLVLGASLAVLIVSAAIIALLLFAGGAEPTKAAPAGPQPTQVSVPDRQVPHAGHPVAE